MCGNDNGVFSLAPNFLFILELEEGMFSRLWGTRGFGQAWHWLREKRRATSVPLNASLTFVTVPWLSVVEGECSI